MSLDDLRKARIEKLVEIKEAGLDPYPASSERTHEIAQVLLTFDALSAKKSAITLTGRIVAKREHGGSIFFDIKDGSGKIQGYIKEDVLGKKLFEQFHSLMDIGDFVEIKGTLFKTKKEEKTLDVSQFRILTKSLLPLPEKWHGIQDLEERLRLRYVDLIMSEEERAIFVKKSKFWSVIRQFLSEEGGLEVETPVLEQIPGGADAEPFKTHHNALNIDLYLRISLELNLKRLIVGGYDKIFEIGRIFRNEGMDKEHLQDYTQMEMYWAYYDYKKLMGVTGRMYKKVIDEVLGRSVHKYQGHEIDWGKSWPEVDYYSIFEEKTSLNLSKVSDKELKRYAEHAGIDTEKHLGRGRLIDVIFKKKVRPNLIQPCFLILPPVDIEPLAKRWPKDPGRVERFQVVAGGTELGKGFSELNDPIDQKQRFEEQVKLGEAGDKEAQRMDEDFVQALEYGMPPTAGFGLSERFFSFLMDKPVRETVFFPLMRPRE